MKKTGLSTILMAAIIFIGSNAYGQYRVLHGIFVSAGGPTTGTEIIYQTVGQGPVGMTGDPTKVIRSGFWQQAFITSTVDVAFSFFDCQLSGYSVLLNWDLSVSAGEGCINIYRSEDIEGPFIRINKDILSTDECVSYLDDTVAPGKTFYYQLGVVESGREYISSRVYFSIPSRPLTLFQNYPNPFNPITTIRYYLPENGYTKLTIYNVQGKKVAVIVNEIEDAGSHSIEWNALNDRGNPVASGVYYYRLIRGKKAVTKKMIVIR
ncbi:MAG: T9SS type A sorting domain-containing protein [Bacteroidales bacterium]|nr:T9SS type A sorting domain-containing protein [Candidatus Latescibacterota bacterium]